MPYNIFEIHHSCTVLRLPSTAEEIHTRLEGLFSRSRTQNKSDIMQNK